ncbi:MAG: hypothetical protein ACLS30_01905 [Oscillospiraceae bacterium]
MEQDNEGEVEVRDKKFLNFLAYFTDNIYIIVFRESGLAQCQP